MKQKIENREKIAWMIAGGLFAAVIGILIWSSGGTQTSEVQKTELDNMYEKSYYQLVNHTQNIRNGFDKLRVSDDKQQIMLQLVNIKTEADMAEENAGMISADEGMSTDFIKVINQISDYSAYLMHDIQMGGTIANEEREILEELYQCVNSMNTLMVQGQMDMISTIDSGASLEDMRFPEMETAVQNYPVLIYDGPFSETVYNRDPVELSGDEISWEDGKRFVAEFLNCDQASIEQGIDCTGLFDTWGYKVVKDGAEEYVSVTKSGGNVLTLTGFKPNAEPTEAITPETCKERAAAFLKECGFESMKPTYYQVKDDEVTCNFAYSQDDVICYPKLIKVKVSLAGGEVTGFDAQNYYAEPADVETTEPELSMEEARERVTSRLDITGERLAIIPGNTNNQILCYEFHGKLNDLTYIVYIDAKTGKEVKIFKLVEDETGIMVI